MMCCRFVVVVVLLSVLHCTFAGSVEENSFNDWLSENGVEVPPVRFVDFTDTGLGAMAKSDIPAEEVLVQIPRTVFLSSSRLNETGMLEAVEQVEGFTSQYSLALVLLHERYIGDDSKWKPYIDLLPKQLDTSLYFLDNEMEELKGSNLVALTMNRQETISHNYEQIFPFFFENYPDLFDKEVFSLDNFRWALSCVWKYAFFMREGEQTVSVFVPLLDRFNHGPVETNFQLDDEMDGFLTVRTKTDFKKGDQVFVSRGPKSNLEMLMDYGFAYAENPSDNVALNVRMTGDDEFSRVKASLLEIAGLDVNGTYLLRQKIIPESLRKALRIQLLRKEELEVYDRALEGKPVSLPNELRVLRSVLAACNSLMDGYGSTIEEDESLLQNTKLSPRDRSAVLLRVSEMKIIRSVMVKVTEEWRDILIEGFTEEEAKEEPVSENQEP